MSCAFYLDEVDRKAPLPFQGRFLKYRLLRQMLNTAASLPSGPQRAAVDDAFMSSLQLQATDVNRLFEETALQLAASGTTDEKRHKSSFSHLFKLPSVLSKGKHGHSSLNPNAPSEKELADKAYWCREFAQINAVVLRKLLEHHDAMLGSTTGRSLLQACWDDNAGCGTQKCMGAAFLHSPLLAELQALESRVREDTAAATQSALVQESVRAFDPASTLIDQLRTSADPKNDSDFDRQIAYQIQVQNTIKKGVVQHWLDKAQVNDKSTDFGGLKNELEASGVEADASPALVVPLDADCKAAADAGDDEDWTCLSCLNILYQPFGLKCGHRFCKTCVLNAVGLRGMYGDPERVWQQ
ncbi:TPA: hypothetical protein ACH3X1_013432 [Trebouxia sp. C0004]